LNVVDSSGWLEYFADGKNADFFAEAIEDTASLVVPTICVAEVFKVVARQRGEVAAFHAVALMRQGNVTELTLDRAIDASLLGASSKLSLADAIIYASAREFEALLWTQDADFKGLANVKYKARR
jgi:predicted nucleic acid-binding protein